MTTARPEHRFEIAVHVEEGDLDERRHVNNVVYLRWVQDVATAHWRANAPHQALDSIAWVALRHEIDYRRELKLGDTAHGRTWVAEQAQGPRFDRFIRLDDAEGAMCAQVHTTWVLIEQATGRPRRVPEWITATFT